MQTALATAAYNPIRLRNIPQEMADIARERGCGMTRDELIGQGFSDQQITDHAPAAARLLARTV